MNGTPASERLHIVLIGHRNSGKSSLLNAVTGQQVAIVSDVPGTTTDHVSKAMEIVGLGPCLLVDTAGIDDCGELGAKRVDASMDALRSADIVLLVLDAATSRMPALQSGSVPVIPVLNKCDLLDAEGLSRAAAAVEAEYGKAPVYVSATGREGISALIDEIRANIPEDWGAPLLTAGLVDEAALVVLVMPQDIQAPKGRLILPQQQTIRELLDRRCRTVCCAPDTLSATLSSLKETPDAVIADSQVLGLIKPLVPDGVKLTSFSMLLAASKGDIGFFKKSARKIDELGPESRVLIAEACTHVPVSEDIGRVKIPRMLRSRAGESLKVDFCSGRDFPDDLSPYDLVIHCGACMFNRRYVMARVEQAERQGVPMTNYGVTIAYINNLL